MEAYVLPPQLADLTIPQYVALCSGGDEQVIDNPSPEYVEALVQNGKEQRRRTAEAVKEAFQQRGQFWALLTAG